MTTLRVRQTVEMAGFTRQKYHIPLPGGEFFMPVFVNKEDALEAANGDESLIVSIEVDEASLEELEKSRKFEVAKEETND